MKIWVYHNYPSIKMGKNGLFLERSPVGLYTKCQETGMMESSVRTTRSNDQSKWLTELIDRSLRDLMEDHEVNWTSQN